MLFACRTDSRKIGDSVGSPPENTTLISRCGLNESALLKMAFMSSIPNS